MDECDCGCSACNETECFGDGNDGECCDECIHCNYDGVAEFEGDDDA